MYWVHGRPSGVPKFASLITVCAVLAIFGGAAQTADAQIGGSHGSPGLISLDVVDADLSQVVRVLMSSSGMNIVIGDPEIRDKKVTAMLNGIPLETALRYIVESVGSSWHREPDGVYIIGSKPQSSSAPIQDDSFAEKTLAVPATDHFVSRRASKVERVRLYNITPVDAMWILGLYHIDQAPTIETSMVKPPYRSGHYVQRNDGSIEPMMAGEPSFTPTQSSREDPTYAERAPRLPAEALQYPPPPAPPTVTTRPTTAGARTPGAAGQQPGTQTGAPAGLLPEGIDYIMPYELDNSLIVRGDEEGIEELKTIIAKLDVAPRQIMIEARFVAISSNELQSLGINWSLERLNTTFHTQFAPAGNILIGHAAGDLMANLRANLSESRGKLINAPIITTMNNLPGIIGFQTQVPYLDSYIVQGTAGITSQSITRFLDINTQLWVLPRINNADDSITVTIMPQLSDIERFVQTGDSNVPIVNRQYISTSRRVANGETIVLGGLIRKDDQTTVEKIPLLGDLPIIGPLFRSTNKSTDDKELLIFLTPTIVPERPIAGAGIGIMP